MQNSHSLLLSSFVLFLCFYWMRRRHVKLDCNLSCAFMLCLCSVLIFLLCLGSTCQKLICLEMSRFGGCWMWHDRVDCAPDHAITISPTVARSRGFYLGTVLHSISVGYGSIRFWKPFDFISSEQESMHREK